MEIQSSPGSPVGRGGLIVLVIKVWLKTPQNSSLLLLRYPDEDRKARVKMSPKANGNWVRL